MRSLILSGGGARGAYQVGVLQAIADVLEEQKTTRPFEIISGVSAGALNAAYLTAGYHEFSLTTRKLANLWRSLSSDRVFHTDAVSLGKIGLQWMGELSFGGLTAGAPTRSLLDTTPLGNLIDENVDFSGVQKNLVDENLKALAITALDYRTSETITFIQGDPSLPDWVKPRRRSEKVTLGREHILASSAIPILFPPIQVGHRFFGDGCVRNLTPLNPVIRMGSQKILVVGVRRPQEFNPALGPTVSPVDEKPPSVGRVINVLLNSILLDGIETDLDRLERINSLIDRIPENTPTTLHKVDSLFICPSEDIGLLAYQMASRSPRIIRYLLKGLGPLEDASELISYLLFEKEFTSRLIEMGYRDGLALREQLQDFFRS